MSRPQDDRNQEATVYLVRYPGLFPINTLIRNLQGNLDERCTDALVWELMLQAGPVGSYCCLSSLMAALLTARAS
jgi:splicing factor 3B subunit 4